MSRLKFYFTLCIFFLGPLCSGCLFAGTSSICSESKGYIENNSLISVVDIDCSENDGSGLCSVLLSTPAEADGRNFGVFTFTRLAKGKIEIYLNLQAEDHGDEFQAGFDLAEASMPFVEVTAVYQNVNGCTLRSSLILKQ